MSTIYIHFATGFTTIHQLQYQQIDFIPFSLNHYSLLSHLSLKPFSLHSFPTTIFMHYKPTICTFSKLIF